MRVRVMDHVRDPAAEAARRVQGGETLQAVGNDLGVTREWVRQLAGHHGVKASVNKTLRADHKIAAMVVRWRQGWSVEMIKRTFGSASDQTLRKAGVDLCNNTRRSATPGRVLAMAEAGLPVKKIADEIGTKEATIRAVLHQLGYGARDGVPVPLSRVRAP